MYLIGKEREIEIEIFSIFSRKISYANFTAGNIVFANSNYNTLFCVLGSNFAYKKSSVHKARDSMYYNRIFVRISRGCNF